MSKRKLNYRFHNPNPVEVEKILQEEIDQEEKELKKID